MKYLSLLLLLIGNATVLANTGEFTVGPQTESQALQPYMLYLPDPEAGLSLEEALASDKWQPLPSSNLGYRPYPIWTRITLNAPGRLPQRFILYNPRPGTNKIDIHLLQGDRELANHELGALRPFSNHTLRHRFTALPIGIPDNQSLTILSRVETYGPLEAGWILKSVSAFSVWSIRENLLRGMIIGAILIAVVYNLLLWFRLRHTILLTFALYGISIIAIIASYQGLYRIFQSPIPQFIFFYSIWLLICPMTLAMVVNAIFFFDTRAQMPRMHRWLQLQLLIIAMYFIVLILIMQEPQLLRYSPIMHLFSLIIYSSLIVTAIIGMRKKLPGATYYTVGHGSLLITLLLFNMSVAWHILSHETMTYLFPLGMLLDIAFLAMATSERIGWIKHELAMQRHITLVQSRFSTIGKTVGMITHQWRAPLARQGAIMTEMEMLLGQEKSATALQRIEKTLLPRLQECLALLSGTVTEFRAYFAADNRVEHYNPAEVIEQTLALLTWQQSLSHVQTDFTAPAPPRLITGHPATLAHVLMILVENALDIFRERQVETPRIEIALRMDAQHVHILIADNGGGNRARPY